jgi:hypothetical protein
LVSTERGGFEPPVQFDPHTRFPSAYLKPLGHLSTLAALGLRRAETITIGGIAASASGAVGPEIEASFGRFDPLESSLVFELHRPNVNIKTFS